MQIAKIVISQILLSTPSISCNLQNSHIFAKNTNKSDISVSESEDIFQKHLVEFY